MKKIILQIGAIFILNFCLQNTVQSQGSDLHKIPVIVITDLYHPAQDPGDNFDLITAFALSQIDLKAVILDCTEPFRQPVAKDPGEGLFPDGGGPREAGYIPMMQLNFIFDRNVPFAAGPFYKMTTRSDKMLNIPKFQQQGIELLIQTLKNSPTPVQIVSVGSARVLSVAYNREPELFKDKIAKIHLSAGASGPDFLEWNVALDKVAIETILSSDLPIALYPCAADTANGFAYGSCNYPFSYDEHNTYYKLPNMNFINKMDTLLQRYLAFAFQRTQRNDFLRAMENDTLLSSSISNYNHEHYVWETAIWLEVAKLKLICNPEGNYKIVSENAVLPTDKVIPNELHSCKVALCKNGYTFDETTEPTNFSIFYREDPYLYEKALQQALPNLYCTFSTVLRR